MAALPEKVCALCLCLAFLPGRVLGGADLAQLSIEELMEIEVFTVSRKQESLAQAPAAAYVVTREDILRSGATSIPEALRLVPGVEVARIDASKWAVSVRGFNDIFVTKLLVLIDGRSVYTPIFSGVFWDSQDLLMEDIERIEVIRGPGAALWGANAVNGVINIRTRPARQTQGLLLSGRLGSEERSLAAARYGGSAGKSFHYRVYAQRSGRDAMQREGGGAAADDWQRLQAGFRADWEKQGGSLSLQGSAYTGENGQTFDLGAGPDPLHPRRFDAATPVSGGHLQARWERVFSPSADLALQLYYDRAERREAIVAGNLHTFDLDFQHRFRTAAGQEVVWGLGYRLHRDRLQGRFSTDFDPERRTYGLFSGFAQDEVSLSPERLHLVLGARFEHNAFSGFEVQPNLRLLWTPVKRSALWAAISRAVRTPSRGENDIRARSPLQLDAPAGAPPAYALLIGNDEFRAEKLNALELGLRLSPAAPLFFDLAAFFNSYDDLHSLEPELPYLDPDAPEARLLVPVYMRNRMGARTRGAELAVDVRPRPWWSLRSAYTYLHIDIRLDADSAYERGRGWEGVSPRQQFHLRSQLDLPCDLALDLGGRYVGALSYVGLGGYASLDARLAWRPRPGVELALTGQNLLAESRAQMRVPHNPVVATRVQRGAYAALHWTREAR